MVLLSNTGNGSSYLFIFRCQQGVRTVNSKMELADRAVGFVLSITSLSIFTYYTFWVIILVSDTILNEWWLPLFNFLITIFIYWYCVVFQPFVDDDHFVHKYFLPQEYAILLPVSAGVALVCFFSIFVGLVMLKSKRKKAWFLFPFCCTTFSKFSNWECIKCIFEHFIPVSKTTVT